ncbi:uncharacterized protein LMH87_008820 [Akanthomyces muscarius]|uniref:Uncharacterized protein n=1 Tax=Akanthomyces muscarius TaxID=2231603 RepID=A0A9W8UQ12_AKAMU|nr:uncharacterized protein LMH87_008820 [Akanthomyces muscarius]KAJ4158288.1 hypothetical protein LMH87_008820 [Akanthomyces muscarius]
MLQITRAQRWAAAKKGEGLCRKTLFLPRERKKEKRDGRTGGECGRFRDAEMQGGSWLRQGRHFFWTQVHTNTEMNKDLKWGLG